MAKQLGVKQIEMYVGMISKEYQPLLDEVAYLEQQEQQAVRATAMRNVGLYTVLEEVKKCEAKLELLHQEQKRLTGQHHQWWEKGEATETSPLGAEIRRLSRISPTVGEQVRCAKEQAIKNIKLCGITEDVKDIFTRNEEIIANLTKTVAKLPKPKAAKSLK